MGKKEFHSHVIFVKNTFPYKHIHLSLCLHRKILLLTVSWRVQGAEAFFSQHSPCSGVRVLKPHQSADFVVWGFMYLPGKVPRYFPINDAIGSSPQPYEVGSVGVITYYHFPGEASQVRRG